MEHKQNPKTIAKSSKAFQLNIEIDDKKLSAEQRKILLHYLKRSALIHCFATFLPH